MVSLINALTTGNTFEAFLAKAEANSSSSATSSGTVAGTVAGLFAFLTTTFLVLAAGIFSGFLTYVQFQSLMNGQILT